MLTDARPETRVTTPPKLLVPSLKVTVPSGIAVLGELAVTVAVKVTGCPTVDVESEDTTVVVSLALLTGSLTADEVLVANPAAPP